MAASPPNLLECALAYADLGYAVFPCAPGRKQPLTPRGFHDATTDSEQIERWWRQNPHANIAVPTSGLIVIDIDGADNAWLTSEPDKQLDLAVAPVSRTPRGGRHHVFRQPSGKHWSNTTGRVAPGVDTRGDGGYILVPPSIVDGKPYHWEPTLELEVGPGDLPEPPEWLVAILDSLTDAAPRDAPEGGDGNPIPQGQRNATLASLAGTMRRVGMTRTEIFAALTAVNTARCHPPVSAREVEKIAGSVARYEPDGIAVALVENHYEQDFRSSSRLGGPADPGPFPSALIEHAPDIIERALDYYLATAVQAQPILFLASMIAATGTILGHKVRDASGLRTNVYTLGITPSGGGKEATREVVRKFFHFAGLEQMCGPEDFASDAGLIAAVELQNPILFQLDEFGRLMHSVTAGGVRNPHLYNIASVLLKFYGKANSVFRSKAYADPKRNKKIDQPHVCLYGTTVKNNFWRSMDAESIEGGFLPRLLIFESPDDPPPGGATESNPPPEVIEFFTSWTSRRTTNGNLERVHPAPAIVTHTREATGLMEEFFKHQKAQEKLHGSLGVLWSRARENAGKLAMIHACWQARDGPVVNAVSARWAIDLITHVVRHALYEASLCIAEGAFHERCQKILRVLREAKGEEVPQSGLMRAIRNMTPRERDEAIATLAEQRLISIRQEHTGGRPGTFFRAVEG